MTRAAVSSRDLVVARGRHEVLHGLSFDVPAGQVAGLLGPSGCGKTTLLRSVVGTQRLGSGTLEVLGHPAGAAALRGALGYASQSAAVYLDLTVLENVRYLADVLRLPRTEVTRVLEAVGLTGQSRQLTGSLSGGQRNRVNLALALLGSPALLILDEPTVGLDPVLREELWALFRDLALGGTTLLVSSHVMEEAERCDSVLLLRDGHLLAHDSPAALQEATGTTGMDAAFLAMVEPGLSA